MLRCRTMGVVFVLAVALLTACEKKKRPVPQTGVAADAACARRAAEGAGTVAGILARMGESEDFVDIEAMAAELGVQFEQNPCAVLAQAERADLTEDYTAGFIGLLPASDAALSCEARQARLQRRRDLLSGEAATGARATGVAVHVDAWIDREIAECRARPKATPARG